MHYLIDGHNLLAKMSSVTLGEPNAEAELVLLLRRWAAARRNRKLTVIFDGGLPGGQDRLLSTSGVKVVFAPRNRTADDLLNARIQQIRNPSESTVVSDDRAVIRTAQDKRASVTSSGSFAALLDGIDDPKPSTPDETPSMTEEDVNNWLELFGGDREPG
jgi:predicted RNA-binding protein with PIN domain